MGLVSFLGTGSIILVSVAWTGAFLHVAWILDDALDGRTTAGMVRTLFLSDGAGIEWILKLGLDAQDTLSDPDHQNVSAVVFNQLFLLFISFTFCVCVLNLF